MDEMLGNAVEQFTLAADQMQLEDPFRELLTSFHAVHHTQFPVEMDNVAFKMLTGSGSFTTRRGDQRKVASATGRGYHLMKPRP